MMIIGIREIRDMRDKKKSKTGSTRFGIWYEKSVGKLIPKHGCLTYFMLCA